MPVNRCRGCGRDFPTAQGLTGHYTRNPDCRAATNVMHLQTQLLRRQPLPSHAALAMQPNSIDDQLPGLADIEYQPAPTIPAKRHHRVSVEDVTHEEPDDPRFVEHHPTAGRAFPGVHPTSWEARRESDRVQNRAPWAPFESLDEWDLA